jgi:hypothetical protein
MWFIIQQELQNLRWCCFIVTVHEHWIRQSDRPGTCMNDVHDDANGLRAGREVPWPARKANTSGLEKLAKLHIQDLHVHSDAAMVERMEGMEGNIFAQGIQCV